MRKELGLDDPINVRWALYCEARRWISACRSHPRTGSQLLASAWPTFQLTLAAMAFAIPVGVPLGFVAAMRPAA
jgi:peptide/nickel transport system permease protein